MTIKDKKMLIDVWNSHGRVLVRQVDPLPLTVLSIAPIGYMPS